MATTQGRGTVLIGTFSIGEVLSRAFATLRDNPVATLGVAFLFGALPQSLSSYAIIAGGASSGLADPLYASLLGLVSPLIFLLCSMLVQGALTRATVAYASEQRASFAQSIGTGVAFILPLLGLTILMVLGLMLGFVLFVVPGVILFLMWSVAAPALVAERCGVLRAFGRSRALTKGARWKIFGLLLLVLVLVWILSAVIGAITVAGDFMGQMEAMARGTLPMSFILLSAISNTLIIAFWGATQASLYLSLSQWKDGPDIGALEEMFA
ncbi:MAG: hypothetical protein ABW164_05680 [Sphingobium sp.]